MPQDRFIRLKSTRLPICQYLDSIVGSLDKVANLVIQAAPGAGKTSLVPLALLDKVDKSQKILVLEPRRLAVKTAASRMADLLCSPLGEMVGYRIRDESKTSAATKVEVISEAILTKMIQSDPELAGVGVIIFDEFHERSLDLDLALALALEVQQSLRPDLKLLVMSATLDTQAVAKILGEAPTICCEGRSYPVTIEYLGKSGVSDWKPVFLAAIRKALQSSQGDILVFLPGIKEIRQAQTLLEEEKLPDQDQKLSIQTLYGNMSFSEQQAVIKSDLSGRKIILATNIAETSLTIEGVDCVIDSGLAKQTEFDPRVGFDRLKTVWISRASATQRAGRAGRIRPGHCYRLWPEHKNLREFHDPEIKRADLCGLVLELAVWGLDSPQALHFIDQPGKANIAQAKALLQSLHALDGQSKITAHGRQILTLGVHPRVGHMLQKAHTNQQLYLGCLIATLLEEKDLAKGDNQNNWDFQRRVDLALSLGEKKLPHIYKRQKQLLGKFKGKTESCRHADPEQTAELLALIFPDRIAMQRGQGLKLANGTGAELFPGQVMSSELCVVIKLGGKASHSKTNYLDLAIALSRDSFYRLYGEQVKSTEKRWFDPVSQAVKSESVETYRELQLSIKHQPAKDPDQITATLCQGIRSLGVDKLPWNQELRYWQARIEKLRSLSEYQEQFPAVDDLSLGLQLELWLAPFIKGFTRLGQISRDCLAQGLTSLLTWEQSQQLNQLMPERIQVASGSLIQIDYLSHERPILAVKLQEMFGEKQTPSLAKGRIKLLIHLLSPAQRPLQVTDDLASFWQNSYQQVKKEMKGRYPKHPWPDDPLSATATRHTKARMAEQDKKAAHSSH